MDDEHVGPITFSRQWIKNDCHCYVTQIAIEANTVACPPICAIYAFVISFFPFYSFVPLFLFLFFHAGASTSADAPAAEVQCPRSQHFDLHCGETMIGHFSHTHLAILLSLT